VTGLRVSIYNLTIFIKKSKKRLQALERETENTQLAEEYWKMLGD
jgi:hypothetical protein